MIRVLRKILKVLLKILLYLVLLVTIVAVVFHLPPVQNRLSRIAGRMINRQLNTPLEIGKLYVSLLDGIEIEDLIITNGPADTILAVSQAGVDLRYISLLRRELDIQQFRMRGFLVRLVRQEADSSLNIAGLFRESGKSADTTRGRTLGITAGSLDLSEGRFVYDDRPAGSRLSVQLSGLSILFEQISLQQKQIFLEALHLNQVSVIQRTAPRDIGPPAVGDMEQAGPVTVPGGTDITRTGGTDTAGTGGTDTAGTEGDLFNIPWDFRINSLVMEDNSVLIEELPQETGGGDPSDSGFSISGLDARMGDIRLAGRRFTVRLDTFRALVIGYQVDQLEAGLLLDERSARVDKLKFRSGENTLYLDGGMHYPSFGTIQTVPGKVSIQLTFRGESTRGGLAGLIPATLPLKEYPGVALRGSVTGTVDRIGLERFHIAAGEAFQAGFSGSVSELTGAQGLTLVLFLDSARIQTPEVLSWLPDSLVPSFLSPPPDIALHGRFGTGPEESETELFLNTSYGELTVSARMEEDPEWEAPVWEASLSTGGLDLGSLLRKPDTLGMIAFSAGIRQNNPSDRPPEINASLDIHTLELMGYTYDSIYL